MVSAPQFELRDETGTPRRFPAGRALLLGFAGSDEASELSLLLLGAATDAFGDAFDIHAVATPEATAMAISAPNLRLLDDPGHAAATALAVSTLPTVLFIDRAGAVRARLDGFARASWQQLFETLITHALTPAPLLDWAAFPASLPAVPIED